MSHFAENKLDSSQLPKSTVVVDGSILEGGGQILRVSIALASLLYIPLHIHSIRGKRPKPGLAAQHLTGIEATAALCNGTLYGNKLRSNEIIFLPSLSNGKTPSRASITNSSFIFEVGTAGAITLVVQALFPVLSYSKVCTGRNPALGQGDLSVSVSGGTDVPFSPPIDHTKHVLLPLLERLCGDRINRYNISTLTRGYMPCGGGLIRINKIQESSVTVGTSNLSLPPPFQQMCAGEPVAIRGVISGTTNNQHYLGTCAAIKELLQSGLVQLFLNKSKYSALPIDISVEFSQEENISISENTSGTNSNSSDVQQTVKKIGRGKHAKGVKAEANSLDTMNGAVLVYIQTSTGCFLSSNKLFSFKIGKSIDDKVSKSVALTCRDLFNRIDRLVETGACIDEYTADQLLLYMALEKHYCTNTTDATAENVANSCLLVEPHSKHSSLHIETTIYIIEKFLKKKVFQLEKVENDCRLISTI